jgi:S1-C subfamily serine protease
MPGIDVSAPSNKILASPGIEAAAPSVVRITGYACGIGVAGSGWVAAPDIVVTNAHVVAGQHETIVQSNLSAIEATQSTPAGLRATLIAKGLRARVLAFNPFVDLAVLYVPNLRLPALSIDPKPATGEAGAILGYPGDGPFNAQPARIGASELSPTEDIYNKTVPRKVTPIAGLVRPGNSGGPLVNARGSVIATVYARELISRGEKAGGYGVANSNLASMITSAERNKQLHQRASTGRCTNY